MKENITEKIKEISQKRCEICFESQGFIPCNDTRVEFVGDGTIKVGCEKFNREFPEAFERIKNNKPIKFKDLDLFSNNKQYQRYLDGKL